MNTAPLKKYAPKARQDFIKAVTQQAARVGITDKVVAPAELKGDVLWVDFPGNALTLPASFNKARAELAAQVQEQGFAQVMEQAAYSWFNRLCALRFMELKGYLDHGRRVLSHPERAEGIELLDDCLNIDLASLDPDLDLQEIRQLKLDNKDEALYRRLLLAQCHQLHRAMPFLFEALDDATELLLPDNLTKTDSLLRELVTAIPEDCWEDVEIIGWLYQFYISEKKDQVIGKVVKSEDIPAATQLFTPNWIVQYLVQNSVGRLWLQTYPESPLQSQMDYYIQPGEQPPEVAEQLRSQIPEQIDPQSIKVLDPAMGSGHILVEAYKLLRSIYEERGYRLRDIPQLILTHNLFGLDIDDRAAQLAGFAVMMLARADDRRIFSRTDEQGRPLQLHLLALKESGKLPLDKVWKDLNLAGQWHQGQSEGLFDAPQASLASSDARYALIQRTLERFSQAKTFGSLIEVPAEEAQPLKELLDQLHDLSEQGDTLQRPAANKLLPFVHQAWLLAQRYDAVIANPPYMGSRFINTALKEVVKKYYRSPKGDLFAAAMLRFQGLSKDKGYICFMTPTVWLYLETYERLRKWLLEECTITSLVSPQYHTFFDSAAVPICAFSITKNKIPNYVCDFFGLEQFKGADLQPVKFIEGIKYESSKWRHRVPIDEFIYFPKSVIAYELGSSFRKAFMNSRSIKDKIDLRQGMATTDNDRFLRRWYEVSLKNIAFGASSAEEGNSTGRNWFPYNKGGPFRKWYGNNEYVVLYKDDGREMIDLVRSKYPKISDPEFVIKNRKYYFRPSITWSSLTIASLSLRLNGPGFIFDTKGQCGFSESEEELYMVMAFLNSSVASYAASAIAPTMDYNSGTIENIPYILPEKDIENKIYNNSMKARELSKEDWDNYETSWDFDRPPLVSSGSMKYSGDTARASYIKHIENIGCNSELLRKIEEEINRIFIHTFKLESEVSGEVKKVHVTLTSNPHYRYGGKLTDEEREARLQSDTLAELVSYAIGCMMGRYSIDEPGLILASQGESLYDFEQRVPNTRFTPDEDGILPLTDQEWFAEDVTNRLRDFVRVVWGVEKLQENLDFIAESLCQHAIKPKRGETALDTLRRYLSTQFYKDHLRTYKKRPIYWLFSSGKNKAFECLVYLHRYNESTLARMRTQYVIPLGTRMSNYIQKLDEDKDNASSTTEAKRIEKELAHLQKQLHELNQFDEKLRHYADQRIQLDLDDGVKVNYGKFGDLLANVKEITGEKPT